MLYHLNVSITNLYGFVTYSKLSIFEIFILTLIRVLNNIFMIWNIAMMHVLNRTCTFLCAYKGIEGLCHLILIGISIS